MFFTENEQDVVGLQSGVKVPFGNISAHYTSPLDLWIVVGKGFSMFISKLFRRVCNMFYSGKHWALGLGWFRSHWFLFEDTPSGAL